MIAAPDASVATSLYFDAMLTPILPVPVIW